MINNKTWLSQLDSTNHLQLLGRILSGTNSILETLTGRKLNILVHCTDGWDRTAQLCSLAQLCLDPHLRTIEGFKTLV